MITEEIFDINDDEENLPDNHYLLMWDENGIEAVIPINMSKLEGGGAFLAALEDREHEYPKQISKLLFILTIRAQANAHRHYEIYFQKTSGNISEQNMLDMFEQHPQNAADLIREKGIQLYSNRANHKVAIY